jgi:hypothetical protein
VAVMRPPPYAVQAHPEMLANSQAVWTDKQPGCGVPHCSSLDPLQAACSACNTCSTCSD